MVVLLFSDDLVIGIESNAARPFRQRSGDYFPRESYSRRPTLSRGAGQASLRDRDACDHINCEAIAALRAGVMDQAAMERAVDILWQARLAGRRLDILPEDCRPASLDEGYAIQDIMAARCGQ